MNQHLLLRRQRKTMLLNNPKEDLSMRNKLIIGFLVVGGIFIVTGLLSITATIARGAENPEGQVYTMSNSPEGNEVLVFDRDTRGILTPVGNFPTGGLGTGEALGNQGGIILDPSFRWLLVVNAGDGTISSFEVEENGLNLINTEASGGYSPVSITVFGTLVYVVNAGNPENPVSNPDNISGFRLGEDGTLTPIPGSTKPLSQDLTAPAQISFNRGGTVLVITEKATRIIGTYTVNSDGTPGTFNTRTAAVPTPFGFSFGDRDTVFISEANGGNAGVVASYRVNPETGIVTGPPVSILQAENATCWVVISNDGAIGYATNTASSTISIFQINFDGTLQLLDGRFSARTGAGPIDLVITRDGENVYSLNSGDNEIQAFTVRRDGGLLGRRSVPVPGGANGLAVR